MRIRNKSRLNSLLIAKLDPAYLEDSEPINSTEDIWNPRYRDFWDAERGIAYNGEYGPVYDTGVGAEVTDDVPR